MSVTAITAANIDFVVQTNQTFEDALQFGTPGDTSWSLSNQNFRMDLKPNKLTSTSPLVTLTSAAGQIVVLDPIQRIVQFNVPESVFAAAGVIAGDYDYDFIMFDNSVPSIRVPLMHGKFKMRIGVTGG